MWETTEYYIPPSELWRTKTIQANKPAELDMRIQKFIKSMNQNQVIQSIQFGGSSNRGIYTAMIVYFEGGD